MDKRISPLNSYSCALTLCALMLLTGCKPQSMPAAQPAEVTLVSPQWKTYDPTVQLTGTVTASAQVELTARVAGTLQQINFHDGDWVQAGQTLFVIEPDSYKAQLRYDEAALEEAQRNLVRQQMLYNKGAVPLATYQDAKSSRDQAEAQRDIAQINLSYTQVVAPFSGRIGQRQVDVGNVVGQGGATTLATLNRTAPVYVEFTLDQAHASAMGLTAINPTAFPRLPVEIAVPGSDLHFQSRIDFVDNQLDSATGTLTLRTTLNPAKMQLLPGMYVQVKLHQGEAQQTRQIPSSALWRSPQGTKVFSVDKDNRVHSVTVKTSPAEGEWVTLREPTPPPQRLLKEARPELEGTQVRISKDTPAS